MNDLAKQTYLARQEQDLIPPAHEGPAALPMSLTPAQLIQVAVQRGEGLDYLRELMALERDWKAERAKEAFYAAMAEFKKVPVTVIKDKENKQYSTGEHKAMYTSLGNLVNTVNAAMAPFGLNASWEIDQTNGVEVTCVLTHTLGFSKSVVMRGPPDESGKKNPLQQIRSTVTYLQAATFQAATGIVAQDGAGDDDGNDAYERISPKDLADLDALIVEVKANKADFLKTLQIEHLADLPAKSLKLAVIALRAKAKADAKGETAK